MPTTAETGLTILRAIVYDLNLSMPDLVKDEFNDITGLDKATSERGITYLIQSGYLIRHHGDEVQLTLAGENYVKNAMVGQYPLSIVAERILRHLVETPRGKGQSSSRAHIEVALNIDTDRYEQACYTLIDYDLIECQIEQGVFELITATQKGKQAVHDNFRRPNTPNTNITADAYIEQMSGGNLQSIATAYDSEIQQIINQHDVESLRKSISEALEKLVAEVSVQLDMEQKAAYMRVAADLQQEVTKSNPDILVIEKAVKVLVFGDSLDGTLELGEKLFTAVALAAPYIGIIAHAVERLIQSLSS